MSVTTLPPKGKPKKHAIMRKDQYISYLVMTAPGLILYEHRFEYDRIPAPRILPDMTYGPAPDPSRTIRVYRRVDSRLILEDMYCKLALFAARSHS